MTNNMFYELTINPETDCMFIKLKDEQYNHILAKVGNVGYTQDNELEFDLELQEIHKDYYDDDKFTNLIQNAVYDIVATSVQKYWQEAEMVVLQGVEQRVAQILDPYKINIGDKSYLESFGEKGYMVIENSEDDNRLTAINLKDQKTYYFDNDDDLGFLKTVIGGSSLIL